MTGLLHYFGSGIVVFVHPMTKPHNAKRIVFVLCLVDVFRNVINAANSSIMLRTASLAPPCDGPHKAAIPAAMAA